MASINYDALLNDHQSNPIDYDALTNQVSHTDNPDYPGDSTSPSLTQDQVSQIANDQVKNSPNLSQAIGQAGANVGKYAPAAGAIAGTMLFPEGWILPALASSIGQGTGKVVSNAMTPGSSLLQDVPQNMAMGAVTGEGGALLGKGLGYLGGKYAATQADPVAQSLLDSLQNNSKVDSNVGKSTIVSSILDRLPGGSDAERELTARQPVQDYFKDLANKSAGKAILDPANYDKHMATSSMLNRLSSSSPEDIMNSSDLSNLQGQTGLQNEVADIKPSIASDKKGANYVGTNSGAAYLQGLLSRLDPELKNTTNKSKKYYNNVKDKAQSLGNTAETIGNLLPQR